MRNALRSKRWARSPRSDFLVRYRSTRGSRVPRRSLSQRSSWPTWQVRKLLPSPLTCPVLVPCGGSRSPASQRTLWCHMVELGATLVVEEASAAVDDTLLLAPTPVAREETVPQPIPTTKAQVRRAPICRPPEETAVDTVVHAKVAGLGRHQFRPKFAIFRLCPDCS